MAVDKISLIMENILNNPGLLHLAENIFWNLENQKLEVCEGINQSLNIILNNPSFWLGKLIQRGLSEQNKKDWIKAIQLIKTSDMYKNVTLYLRWKLKMNSEADLPCYTSPFDQDDFLALVKADIIATRYCSRYGYPLTGETPIYRAASFGDTEIVKILAPLTDNPNSPNKDGKTPSSATKNAEIQRYLKSINTSKNL